VQDWWFSRLTGLVYVGAFHKALKLCKVLDWINVSKFHYTYVFQL
jgi:hypothetical protein